MARPELSEDELRSVAEQIAAFVNPNTRSFNEIAAFGAGNEPLALHESFPLVHIDRKRARAALKAQEDLSTALVSLGQWHHQLRAGATAQAFARSQSVKRGPTHMSVRLLERSDDAFLIDQAIRVLDGDPAIDTDGFDPAILDSREFDVGALVLIPDQNSSNPHSLVQVYRAPSGQRELLQAGRRYESEDFLRRFVMLVPVSGVSFELGDQARL